MSEHAARPGVLPLGSRQPMARVGAGLHGAVHGDPGRDDRERCSAVHPGRPRDVGCGPQWIVNAYTLVFGGFLLLGGRAGDLVGRKRIFLIGVVIFTVASLLNGLAPSSKSSSSAAGFGARCRPHRAGGPFDHHDDVRRGRRAREGDERVGGDRGRWRRGRALLGGILVDAFSWPWIFFVNIPVGIAVFVASLRFVPESKDERAHKSFDVAERSP